MIAAGCLLVAAGCSTGPSGSAADDTTTLGLTVNGTVFEVEGPEGGPFPDDIRSVELVNTGPIGIEWEVEAPVQWLIFSETSGALGSGKDTIIDVRIDQQTAAALSVGQYVEEVTFKDRNDPIGHAVVTFILTVLEGTQGDKLIIPGAGFAGPTTEPGQIGSGSGAEAKAIARWDVIPYQTATTDFNVGIVAFHINGIDRVEFSAEGGDWLPVRSMTLNSRTGATEYWATVRPSLFGFSGQVELRAIAYPTVGKPRLLDSLFMTVDHTGDSLGNPVVYVSNAGSSSGDGSLSDPYKTIGDAAEKLEQQNNGLADGGIIYLLPGNYEYGPATQANTSERWLTVMPAPGVERHEVVIDETANGGLRTKLVHLKDVTVTETLKASYSDEDYIWVEGCDLVGPGRLDEPAGAGFINRQTWTNFYALDTTVRETRDALRGAGIQRDCLVKDIGQDAYTDCKLIVNCKVDTIDPSGSSPPFHSDVVQTNPSDNTENRIYYGLEALNVDAQGLFCNGNGDGTLRDFAFVNIVIDWSGPPSDKRSAFLDLDEMNHILFWNISSNQNFTWRLADHKVHNISVRGNVWLQYIATQDASPAILDDEDVAHNHVLSDSASNSFSPGFDFTVGDPGWEDEAGDNFHPLPGSILLARMPDALAPVTIDGEPTINPAAVGCFEVE